MYLSAHLSPYLAAGLATITALHLLITTAWLGTMRPEYSHLRHTISELGEAGSATAKQAAWISFAPTGLLFGASLVVIHRWLPSDSDITQGLILFGAVGGAYLLSAVFPCDAGAPVVGSFRNTIHLLVGAAEYLGALGGLDLISRTLADDAVWSPLATATRVAFPVVFLSFLGLAFPNPVRGLTQRISETAIFGWLVAAGWSVVVLPA